MEKTKLYSPTQITLATFCGGPIAMVYTLKKNFDALGNLDRSKTTLIWGTIFTGLLLFSLPFLSKNFPHGVIPIAYTCFARQMARFYQLPKQDIAVSDRFTFQSNWNVLGLSVVSFLAFIALAFVWICILAALGLHRPK